MRVWAFIVLLSCAAPVAAQDFFTLKGHGGPIMDIAVAADGRIATASFDNSVGLWNETKPRWLEGHAAAVNSVAYLHDNVLLSAGDDFALWLWEDGEGLKLGEHSGKIVDIASDPSGEIIATASWDGTIGLWTAIKSGDPARWNVISKFLKGHKSGVNAVAFSQDGKRLYSASSDGTIRVWSEGGQSSRVLVSHGFGVNELIVNEDEGWIAYGAVDGGTRLIDLETGAEIADFTLDRRPILSLAFHRASGQLAVGDGEGYIMVIDIAAQRIIRDFKAARQGPVWALAFSPDGLNIHAAGIEDILYSWPVETLTEHGQMATATRSFLEEPETMSNGERQFKRKCSICHSLSPGSARRAGPTLYRIFGRRAGTVTDYSYSDTLDGADIIWSNETIDALFDLGPDHYIPGTKMPMQRITASKDRDDLIEYLRLATAPKEN